VLGLVQFTLAAVLLGCLALNQGNDLDSNDLVSNAHTGLVDMHAYNISSVLYAVVVLTLVSTAFAVPHLHSASQCIRAETTAGLVRTVSSWATLVVVDLFMYAVACAALSAVVHSLANIQGSIATYYWLLVLVAWCGYSLAAVCAIWLSQSLRIVWLCYAAMGGACLIFTGFLQRLGSLGGLWWFLAQLSFTRWAFEGLSISAFSDAPDSESYLQLFGFDHTRESDCAVLLVLWFILLQSLVLVGLLPASSERRVLSAIRNRLPALSRSGANRDSNASYSGDSTGGTGSEALSSQYMRERMDAIWEAARAIAQTPVKRSKRRKNNKGTAGTVANSGGTGINGTAGNTGKPPAHTRHGMQSANTAVGVVHPPSALSESTQQATTAEADDEVTLRFENVNSLFGPEMHVQDAHSAPQPPAPPLLSVALPQSLNAPNDPVSGTSTTKKGTGATTKAPPPRPPGAAQAIQNTSSYSERIRRGAAAKMGPQSVAEGTPQATLGFSTPTKVPLLSAEPDSAESSPVVYATNGARSPGVLETVMKNNDGNSSSRRRAQRSSGNLFGASSIVSDASLRSAESQLLDCEPPSGQVVQLSAAQSATLSFSRVKYVQQGYEHAPSLQGISYKLQPGSCCCVVDGSGEGAATLLLQVLAGKTLDLGKTTGVICVNDQRIGQKCECVRCTMQYSAVEKRCSFSRISAAPFYVLKDLCIDLMHS
jgi:ABC-type multidrug transport system fused ATPase/permease subunit